MSNGLVIRAEMGSKQSWTKYFKYQVLQNNKHETMSLMFISRP